jgi:hypothetical protein
VGPKTGLDDVVNQKYVPPPRNRTSIFRSSSPYPSHYNHCATPNPSACTYIKYFICLKICFSLSVDEDRNADKKTGSEKNVDTQWDISLL